MNKAHSLLIAFLPVFALGSATYDAGSSSLLVDTTNLVTIAFEDETLSQSSKETILSDFTNIVAPCAARISIGRGNAEALQQLGMPLPPGWSYDMYASPSLDNLQFPQTPFGAKTIDAYRFSVQGTNMLLTLKRDFTDCYTKILPLSQTYYDNHWWISYWYLEDMDKSW